MKLITTTAYLLLTLLTALPEELRAKNEAGAVSETYLEGVVRDASGDPLPGVHILVLQSGAGAITDRDGRFRITTLAPGEYTLRISMVGFETVRLEFTLLEGEPLQLIIPLNMITLQSGELVVTASRRSQLIGRVSVSMSMVTPEEIRSRNVVSLDQALETVPGVQILGNSVNIRGSSGFTYGVGSRVLLLVDGVPLMGPDQGGMDFDGLPISQTRQIEVLKSPGSALYGGGALGGVVNLITREYAQRPETSFRLTNGFYQPVRYSQWKQNWADADEYRPFRGVVFGRSHQATQRFGYWVSGRFQQNEGYLQNNRSLGGELYSKFGWKFSSGHEFSFYSSVRRNRNQQFLYWNGLSDVLRPGEIQLGTEKLSGSNEGLSDRITLLPVYSHQIGDAIQVTARGRLFGVAFRPIDSQGNVRDRDKHNVGVRYGGEIQGDIDAGSGLFITAGGTFDENYIRADVYVGTDSLTVRNQPEGSLFLQAEKEWNRRLTTTAGVRYDAYQVHTLSTASQLSPKFSSSMLLTDQLVARVSFGRGFRVPSVAERFFSNSEFFPLESNLTLRPETSTGYEGGFTWMHLIRNRFSLKAELTGFWNEYKDLVEPTFFAERGSFRFVNLTSARIAGAELSVSLETTDQKQRIQAAYTHLDALDREENRPLVYRSRHLVQLSGKTDITSRLELGADFRWSSAPDQVDTDFSLFVPDAELFPSIYITDLRLGYQIVRQNSFNLTASVLVRNLFNHYYIERPAIFAPPRNAQFVLETRF